MISIDNKKCYFNGVVESTLLTRYMCGKFVTKLGEIYGCPVVTVAEIHVKNVLFINNSNFQVVENVM